MAHVLTVDPTHGVGAGMLLAALLDAGAPAERVRHDVAALGRGEVRMSWVRVRRGDAPALVATVRAPEGTPHVASPDQVLSVVEHTAVDDAVRDLAASAMAHLLAAAASTADVGLQDLDLPETVMLDHLAMSLAIGSCLVALDVRRTAVVAPVPVGHGAAWPDPVVVSLLAPLPTTPGTTPDVEFTDRLGAAWLRTLEPSTRAVEGRPVAIGRGAPRDVRHDGVLRVLLHEPDREAVP